MPKKKLIEFTEDPHLYCDNPECGFKLPEVIPADEWAEWINSKCPHCESNLLTQEDYNRYISVVKSINWLNKWFSWITIFIPNRVKPTYAQVDTHEKITITEIDKAA